MDYFFILSLPLVFFIIEALLLLFNIQLCSSHFTTSPDGNESSSKRSPLQSNNDLILVFPSKPPPTAFMEGENQPPLERGRRRRRMLLLNNNTGNNITRRNNNSDLGKEKEDEIKEAGGDLEKALSLARSTDLVSLKRKMKEEIINENKSNSSHFEKNENKTFASSGRISTLNTPMVGGSPPRLIEEAKEEKENHRRRESASVTAASVAKYERGAHTGIRPFPQRAYEPETRLPDIIVQTHHAYQIYNVKKKWFACLVPKVGCSTWLDYLRKAEELPAQEVFYDKIDYPERGFYFRKNDQKDLKVVKRLINDEQAFKFVVVRHPWSRLLSAYRSKYEGFCHYNRSCFQERFNIHVDANITSANLTFHDFVVALHRVQEPHKLEKHFRPMHYLCELGHIPYSFVANLESVDDGNFISKQLGYNRTYHEVEKELYSHTRGQHYYHGATHLVQPCTEETVHLASMIYGQDAHILGYHFDEAYASCRKYGLSSQPAIS